MMNASIAKIREKHDFDNMYKLVSSVFHTDLRFPHQVFKRDTGEYRFEQFDWAMSADFWFTLQKLAHSAGDAYVLAGILDPSPTNYFYPEFGYYNWYKIPIDVTAHDYWTMLESGPEESPVDAMLFNSEIVVWVSPSMKWGIWGERPYEICVLAVWDEGVEQCPAVTSWWSVHEAIESFVPIDYMDRVVAKEFSEALRRNYSKLQEL